MIMFGYLQTSFSLLQLIGGPIVGRLCDTRGPRSALVMSQFAATLNYSLLALAYNVPLLFVSQLPTLFMHCMHAAQAAITRLSSDEARATSLARLSLSYGIGMICGSFLGGYIGKEFGYGTVSWCAAVSSFSTIPLNYQYLPPLSVDTKEDKEKATGLDVSAVLRLAKKPAVRDLMFLQFFVGMGLSVYRSSFSQALRLRFDLQAHEIGQFMSLAALVSVGSNILLVPVATKHASETTILYGSIALFGICMVLYAFAGALAHVIAISIPLSAASSLVYTMFSSRMTKSVEQQDSGTSIGLSHATRTLCGVLSPTVAGYIYQDIGFAALGGFSACSAALALIYVSVTAGYRRSKDKIM